MKTLQVKLNGKWEYVFCYNVLKSDPIVTNRQSAALRPNDLQYFQTRFGNHEFRVGNKLSQA